jgi:hypothetical protein
MQIGLTKKLSDYVKNKPAPADAAIDPLFSWSANLLTLQRRKTIVCMNDATRFAFILYGVKAADVKRLDRLMLDGIRACMALEGIAPEAVERYLSEGNGNPQVSFGKLSSRKTVAALNHVCETVKFMAEREEVFPTEAQRLTLNRQVFHLDKGTLGIPCDLLLGRLRERYGEPIVRADAAELTVTLDLDGKDAVRRLVVPTFFTFAELHQVIQSVYRWRDYHLHSFILPGSGPGRPGEALVGDGDEGEEENRHDADVRLSEVFGGDALSEGSVIAYLYDYGDGWYHAVRFERTVKDYNANFARCTLMEGDAPPEDSGGPGGFQNLLEILKDKAHPEYAEMNEWADGMRWKPLREGDMDAVNRRLARREYGFWWF